MADTAKVLQLLDRGWRFGDRDEGGVVACLERQFGLSLIAGLRIHDGIRPDDRGGEPKRQRLGYVDFGATKPSYDVARSNDITLGAISVVVCCEVLRDLESLGATKA